MMPGLPWGAILVIHGRFWAWKKAAYAAFSVFLISSSILSDRGADGVSLGVGQDFQPSAAAVRFWLFLAAPKPKTLQEAIAACISELKRRNPDVARSRHP
jgi:hypothetical protein